MESSSENSFTWTDTSSDSIDSHSMAIDEKKVESDHTKRISHSNGSTMEYDTKMKNKKQLKSEKYNITRENMVKLEPESDSDTPRKKKKIKHVKTNGDDLHNSNSYDETFLDLKVKEEMSAPSSACKIKKKRHLSDSIHENDSDTKKNTVKETSPDSHIGSLDVQPNTELKKKKKKKKKSKPKSENEGQEMQYSHSKECEDIVNNEENDSPSKIYMSRREKNSLTESTFQNESDNEISAIQCDDNENIHTLSFNSGRNVENKNRAHSDSLYKSAIINQLKLDKNDETTDKQRPRLSDRIRFEDEDDSGTEFSDIKRNTCDDSSLKLKKFIKASDNVKLILQELHHSSTLTSDDEMWVVNCPKEIDIQGISYVDLNMHGKSKIKVGQTYDGTLDSEECDATAVLTMEYGKYVIRNLPISGIIKFRKRIPKAHFHNDNIMVNNQTNFIPLPETKCRHPLFGSNYKKSLKIPTAIAQQLNVPNGAEETCTSERRKKKKHKKDTSVLKQEGSDSKCEVRTMLESELVPTVSDKKKRKHKHLDDESPAPKRVKKLKHDPESAEAWESEKAIEQNLFSF